MTVSALAILAYVAKYNLQLWNHEDWEDVQLIEERSECRRMFLASIEDVWNKEARNANACAVGRRRVVSRRSCELLLNKRVSLVSTFCEK